MSVGRYFCVALPFILTAASIICMLIAGLTGVTSTDLFMFRINTTDIQVSPEQIARLIGGGANGDFSSYIDNAIGNLNLKRDEDDTKLEARFDVGSIGNSLGNIGDIATTAIDTLSDVDVEKVITEVMANNGNITGEALNLPKLFDVSLWGFCTTQQNDSKTCTDPEFDWASKHLNISELVTLTDIAGFAGINVEVPQEVKDGLNLFKQVSKWTQVVFVIAAVLLAIELAIGIFTGCSRLVSCIVWIVSGVATVATIAAAAMMTATGSVVVGVAESMGSMYGVQGEINTSFLAVIWLAAAFALAASLFWLFSVCCCKPENRPHKGRKARRGDAEKGAFPAMSRTGSAYHPIGADQHQDSTQYNYGFHPNRGGARSDLAYEPYSHNAH